MFVWAEGGAFLSGRWQVELKKKPASAIITEDFSRFASRSDLTRFDLPGSAGWFGLSSGVSSPGLGPAAA